MDPLCVFVLRAGCGVVCLQKSPYVHSHRGSRYTPPRGQDQIDVSALVYIPHLENFMTLINMCRIFMNKAKRLKSK